MFDSLKKIKTMKRIAFLFVILILAQSCKVDISPRQVFTDENSGQVIDETYDLKFNSISVNTSIDAEVIKSDVQKVVVTAPEKLQEHIRVEVNNGKLNVGMEFNGRISLRVQSIKVKIYTNHFSELSTSSSGNIVLRDKFTQESVSIKANSSGNISGNIEANDLNISTSSSGDFKGEIWALRANLSASSSGDIIISGKVKSVVAKSSSSGDIKAKNLQAEIADLQASSSGDIAISVSDKLDARASSSGDIVVYKKGELSSISKSESSGGSVKVL